MMSLEFISGYKTCYNIKNLHRILEDSKYYVYAYDDIETEKIKCGDFYIYDGDKYSKNLYKKLCEEIEIQNSNQKTLEKIIKYMDFELKFEECANGHNLFGYSPNIREYVTIGQYKINLQINYTENNIKIGSPIIFGYY